MNAARLHQSQSIIGDTPLNRDAIVRKIFARNRSDDSLSWPGRGFQQDLRLVVPMPVKQAETEAITIAVPIQQSLHFTDEISVWRQWLDMLAVQVEHHMTLSSLLPNFDVTTMECAMMYSYRPEVNPDDVEYGEPVKLGSAHRAYILWILLFFSIGVLLYNAWLHASILCPTGIGAVQCIRPDPFLSNEVAIQITAAVLAAFFVLEQMRFSSFPAIGYASSRRREAVAIESDKTNARYWKVHLMNIGTGAAMIADAYYILRLDDAASDRNNYSYEATRLLMMASGLDEYKDFALWKISAGGAVPPGLQVDLFECDDALRGTKIQQLDIVLVYEGRMGDRWAKRIACIPDRNPPLAH
uniref:hypothetical protein n=1 Tax=Sphingomonas bacterium TaxID=1895847 RepID=UPI0026266E1E|nr:hypothetical protein [Sphingomonas bacterium]